MLKVGLTGGYATGKSFVAAELEKLGCHVIYADKLGHQALEPGGEAFGPTVDAFGGGILDADGQIDRKKLGEFVFAAPELLKRLQDIVHPAVFAVEHRMLTELAAGDPRGIAVIEAAILIETGRYTAFDRLILTECDKETQIARGMKRDGLSREQVCARLEKQMPGEEKRKFAHYVVNTSGSKENTVLEIMRIYSELRGLPEVEHV